MNGVTSMKTLRILILAMTLAVFVSVTMTDAVDQGGVAPRTIQIRSAADDFDLPCDKIRHPVLSADPLSSTPPVPVRRIPGYREDAVQPVFDLLLPFFLRAPPLVS